MLDIGLAEGGFVAQVVVHRDCDCQARDVLLSKRSPDELLDPSLVRSGR